MSCPQHCSYSIQYDCYHWYCDVCNDADIEPFQGALGPKGEQGTTGDDGARVSLAVLQVKNLGDHRVLATHLRRVIGGQRVKVEQLEPPEDQDLQGGVARLESWAGGDRR